MTPLPRSAGAARRDAVSVTTANRDRNVRRERARADRWAPARDALWSLLDPLVRPGARVAIVGAGNADDLPLARLAARAAQVVLLDIDPQAPRRALRSVPRGGRRRVELVQHDVTVGAADAIVTAAAGARPDGAAATAGAERTEDDARTTTALPGGPYDLVVGDLFYSQLLHPAMVDLDVPHEQRQAVSRRHAPGLVGDVVARLEASAPGGTVVHLHDVACWEPSYDQPRTLAEILDAADRDVDAALALAAQTRGPRSTDPRRAVAARGTPVTATRLWAWPFVAGVDYLVVATVTTPTA